MGLVNPTQVNPGDEITAASINTPSNQIAAVVNGNIDSANLADGAVGTTEISDGAVTNAKLETGAGEPGGAWDTWTPSLTNLSGGAITYAKYKQVGKTVFCQFLYTLAGAGVAGDVSISVPVNMASHLYTSANTTPIGTASCRDAGANGYPASIMASSATVVTFRVWNASGTYTAVSAMTSTVPFTWGTGDQLYAQFIYEAA